MLVSPKVARASGRNSEQGYVLLTIILSVAILAIACSILLPTLSFQIKRDREQELIHRGVQYSRAIQHYYKKFGRYPTRIEDLENTNQVRFLRRRYKDPITGKDFKLLYMQDVQMFPAGGVNGASPLANGLSEGVNGPISNGGALNQLGGPGGSPILQPAPGFGGPQAGNGPMVNQNGFGNSGFGNSGFGNSGFGNNGNQSSFGNSGFGNNNNSGGTVTNGLTTGQNQAQQNGDNSNSSDSENGQQGQNQPGDASNGTNGANGPGGQQPGNSASGNNNNQVFGGGPIVGVASTSKDKTIRVFSKKEHYNEWQFIYNPTMDQGGLLTMPNVPSLGAGITPAGQSSGTPGAQGTPGQPGQPGQLGSQPNQPTGQPGQPGQPNQPNSNQPQSGQQDNPEE